MGRSVTPKYIVKVNHAGPVQSTDSAWSCKQSGRPTNLNLKRWVTSYHESLRHDGCNAHVAAAYGDGANILSAFILLNDGSRTVVAMYGDNPPCCPSHDAGSEAGECSDVTPQAAARSRVISYLEILEEHTADAEKDGNTELAGMLGAFRTALYAADADQSGHVTLKLDLSK